MCTLKQTALHMKGSHTESRTVIAWHWTYTPVHKYQERHKTYTTTSAQTIPHTTIGSYAGDCNHYLDLSLANTSATRYESGQLCSSMFAEN